MSEDNIIQHPLNEDLSLISSINVFQPIQKNTELFKFILLTTKVEIKFNSLIFYFLDIKIIISLIKSFYIFLIKLRIFNKINI